MPIKEESQQPNAGRQHPIPQNVMDVEFKVVGDLTVRQLMYIFAGGVFAYLIFRSGLPGFWRWIISFLSVVLTVAVAFVPYEERGLDKWITSFLKAMTMPTQMVWRKTYSPPAYFLSDYANIIKNEIITLTPAKSRNKLDDYLGQLSESENELDRLEASRLQSIKLGFADVTNTSVVVSQPTMRSSAPSLGGSSQSQTDLSYADDVSTPGRTLQDSGSNDNNVLTFPNQPEKQQQRPSQTPQQEVERKQTPEPTPTREEPIGRQQLQQNRLEVIQNQPKTQQTPQQKKPVQQPVSEERRAVAQAIKEDEISSKKELMNSIEMKQPTLAAPSIDRAIISIPENPRGEIKIKTTTKLPKVIVVQDIKELETKESSLEKKVSELLDVTKQVRAEMQSASDKEAHISKNQSRIEFFNTKYKELEEEREKITTQLDASSSQVQQIAPKGGTDLNKQVEDLSIKNEELKAQLAQIQKEISILKNAPTQQAQAQTQPETPTTPPVPQPKEMREPEKKAQSLNKEAKQENMSKSTKPTGSANLITGIVKNKSGEPIDNAVVIIKDKDGDAIRALKTNQLGQFKTQTPMQNGKYTVEVIKGGMKFDIISVEAQGQPISPLSIIAYE